MITFSLANARGQRPDGTGLPEIHHVGLVVADLDRTLGDWQQAFGFAPAHVIDAALPMARASNGVVGFNLRAGFLWTGNTLLELLQPLDDRSPHAAFLKERGEGLHHLGFLVRSIEHELDAMTLAQGGERPSLLIDATSGAADGMSMCYVEGGYAPGLVVELIERSPQTERFLEAIYAVTGGRLPA